MATERTKPSCLFRIVDFLNGSSYMKKLVCRKFIYKPPSPAGYSFEQSSRYDEEDKYKFYVRKERRNEALKVPSNMECEPYLLCTRDKKNKKQEIPLTHMKNSLVNDNFLIIYSHGNGSDLGDVIHHAINISKLYKINVISYDYRGYGISKNELNELTTYEDLEMVLSFAVHHLRYELTKIILWGFSLGTGPTIEIASRYQNLAGVVLQSPLASVLSWIDENAAWNMDYSPNDIYSNLHKIENIKTKIFLIHGKDDKIISVRHSHMLYEKYTKAAPENDQIWFIVADGAGHNDIQALFEDPESAFSKRAKKFLKLVKYAVNNPKKLILNEKDEIREKTRLSFFEKEYESLKLTYNKLLKNGLAITPDVNKDKTRDRKSVV